MSRSKRDQRGKRDAGEIAGRSCLDVVAGRLIMRAGGEEVGSARNKRIAKRQVSRKRRRELLPAAADLQG